MYTQIPNWDFYLLSLFLLTLHFATKHVVDLFSKYESTFYGERYLHDGGRYHGQFQPHQSARSLVIICIVTVLISYITVNAFAARMCWLVISQLMPLRHGCPATVAVGSRTYM